MPQITCNKLWICLYVLRGKFTIIDLIKFHLPFNMSLGRENTLANLLNYQLN